VPELDHHAAVVARGAEPEHVAVRERCLHVHAGVVDVDAARAVRVVHGGALRVDPDARMKRGHPRHVEGEAALRVRADQHLVDGVFHDEAAALEGAGQHGERRVKRGVGHEARGPRARADSRE
jgi:hypothetical protein